MSSPDVLLFQCRACGIPLSVPASMAGITGPCPSCGHQITSPTLQEAKQMVQLRSNPPSTNEPDPLPAVAPQTSISPGKVKTSTFPTTLVNSETSEVHPDHPVQVPIGNAPSTAEGTKIEKLAPAQPNTSPAPYPGEFRADVELGAAAQHSHPHDQQRGEWMPTETSAISGTPRDDDQQPLAHKTKTILPAKRGRVSASTTPERAAVMDHRFHPRHESMEVKEGEIHSEGIVHEPASAANMPAYGDSRSWDHEARNEYALTTWQDPALAPVRTSRFKVFLIALLMILAAGTGIWIVFENQLRMVWHSYRMQFDKDQSTVIPTPKSSEEISTSPLQQTPNERPIDDSFMSGLNQSLQENTPPQPMVHPPDAPQPTPPETQEKQMPSMKPVTSGIHDASFHVADEMSNQTSAVVEVTKDEGMGFQIRKGEVPVPALFLNPPEQMKEAVEALRSFLQAPNWYERARYVQMEKEIRPLMEQYYQSAPDGVIHILDVQPILGSSTDQSEAENRHYVFKLAGADVGLSLPVMVENSEEGWKVDWLTFIEGKDRLLEKFYAEYVETPARFRVLARRKRYFEKDVPDVDTKLCFELQPPAPGFVAFAFAEMGTPLARELDRVLGWDVLSATVIMELQWQRVGDQQWVNVVGLHSLNWRMPKPTSTRDEP